MKIEKCKVQAGHIHCNKCDKRLYEGVTYYNVFIDQKIMYESITGLCEECLTELYEKIGKTLKKDKKK